MSYRDEFTNYQKEVYWTVPKLTGMIIFVLLVLGAGVILVTSMLNFGSDAAATAQKELGVSALLRKYEWFKDASAQLDAKQADLGVYETRFKSLKEEYPNQSRSTWAREDREQYNIWVSEFAGIKASYNDLAAQYNAQMSKVNYQFTNVGQLPRGAERPLPREYKPYENH